MRVGVDARLINETGVGRYIKNLLRHFARNARAIDFVVFLPPGYSDVFPQNWTLRYVNVPWHSFREQLEMPYYFYKEDLDLLHVPYFNIPLLYPRRYIVTVHDLIVDHFDTGKASTLPYPLYKIRRLGYSLAQKIGLRKAQKIIAVSNCTKAEIIDHYQIPEEKIEVIYEGIDTGTVRKLGGKREKSDYFLYVGNAYPHKNLEYLIRAFGIFYSKASTQGLIPADFKLVLVGKPDFFYSRLKNELRDLPVRDNIVLYGSAKDDELSILYKKAWALVMPSRMEGFGLPPLEALVNGIPVMVSDIPVFREILGDVPVYFNPNDVNDMVDKFLFFCNNKASVRYNLPDPAGLLAKYNWGKAASETARCYINSIV